MYPLPNISIGIVTYNRLSILKETLDRLRTHIRYPEDKIHYVISDDCTGSDYCAEIEAYCRANKLPAKVVSTATNSGIGANLNNVLFHVDTPFVLLMEDDWHLMQRLDLAPAAALLASETRIGAIKVRTSRALPQHYKQHTSKIADYLPSYVEGHFAGRGEVTWFEMLATAPTLYVWSTGINLIHRRWWMHYGTFREDLSIGATEEEYCHRVKDRARDWNNAPLLATLPEWSWRSPFKHVGDVSFKPTEPTRTPQTA
ncbi:MAG: glycosyltransferase [Chloroflexota bacterium]|nr:glycosyltransferase [Chloroflexota bacterium]